MAGTYIKLPLSGGGGGSGLITAIDDTATINLTETSGTLTADLVVPDVPTLNSPSSIGADQNDYALPAANIVRLTSSAAYNITGFAAPSSGSQSYVLVNIGSFNITLRHENASSTAANRIIVPWAGDLVITAGGSVFVWYDTTSTRWRAA